MSQEKKTFTIEQAIQDMDAIINNGVFNVAYQNMVHFSAIKQVVFGEAINATSLRKQLEATEKDLTEKVAENAELKKEISLSEQCHKKEIDCANGLYKSAVEEIKKLEEALSTQSAELKEIKEMYANVASRLHGRKYTYGELDEIAKELIENSFPTETVATAEPGNGRSPKKA